MQKWSDGHIFPLRPIPSLSYPAYRGWVVPSLYPLQVFYSSLVINLLFRSKGFHIWMQPLCLPFIFYWLNIPNSFRDFRRTRYPGTVLTTPINMRYLNFIVLPMCPRKPVITSFYFILFLICCWVLFCGFYCVWGPRSAVPRAYSWKAQVTAGGVENWTRVSHIQGKNPTCFPVIPALLMLKDKSRNFLVFYVTIEVTKTT